MPTLSSKLCVVLSQQSKVTLPHFQLPDDLGEYLDKVIVTYQGLARPSTSKEFAAKNKELGKSAIVGRALSYLVQLGLMKHAGKRKYDLSSEGQIIRKALASGDISKAQEAWQAELKKHQLYAMLQDYLKGVQGEGTAVGLGSYVKEHVGADWGKSFTDDGGRRLCSLFRLKGLVEYDEKTGSVILRAEKGGEPSKVSREKNLLRVWIGEGGALNITVSDELDPALSKKIVEMVLGSRRVPAK